MTCGRVHVHPGGFGYRPSSEPTVEHQISILPPERMTSRVRVGHPNHCIVVEGRFGECKGEIDGGSAGRFRDVGRRLSERVERTGRDALVAVVVDKGKQWERGSSSRTMRCVRVDT